jgi:hypothetical protein
MPVQKDTVSDAHKHTLLFLAVLLNRIGGSTTITQSEIDAVAYNRLYEKWEEGSVELLLYERPVSS